MQPLRLIALSVSLGLSAAVSGPLAHAQAPAGPLVEMGGQAQAIAEACKTHTAYQLADMKRRQRVGAESMGVSSDEFDKVFSAAYERARAELRAASAEQKTQLCEKMKAIEAAGSNQ